MARYSIIAAEQRDRADQLQRRVNSLQDQVNTHREYLLTNGREKEFLYWLVGKHGIVLAPKMVHADLWPSPSAGTGE